MSGCDDDGALLVAAVTEFYRCENARDWEGVSARVSPNIVSETYPTGERVSGKAGYLRAVADMYRGRTETFEVLSISADARVSTVHAELVIGGKLSVNVFELRDGLIVREREYLGLGYGGVRLPTF
ncbi:nuclear transport factor 2 family protein [Actinomyces ruminicola]|uniref:nuclear transport factor 2 family protein n=1 Tax=Actinomyces ruminicola TaxID=332524 RepID=UPI0011CCBA00|nr:nuclear transport factor 2 family protein [Actinomyces ruminicola]